MENYKDTTYIGNHWEQYACQFLQNHGMTLLKKNYHCLIGEIDLIMKDQHDIVFVEVRYRCAQKYGTALESVNHCKQRKLKNTAAHFLKQQQWLDIKPCRFDIFGIEGSGKTIRTHWIKNAF